MPEPRHLVLVGGGHAHLSALARAGEFLAAGHRVSLVTPSEHQYYSGMGPGMLAGIYRPEQIRFPVGDMAKARGAAFKRASVLRVDAGKRLLFLDSGESLSYDVLSVNVGSLVPFRGISRGEPGVFPVKPVEGLAAARTQVLKMLEDRPDATLLVAGGGPAGIEIACALRRLSRDAGRNARVVLLARPSLLPAFSPKVRGTATRELSRRGVEVVEDAAVSTFADGKALTSDGRVFPADALFLAWGVEPPAFLRESGLAVSKAGALLVNEFLESAAHPGIFGGGDCIEFSPSPLDKVGVYAVRQNPVLFHNLMAALENRPRSPFDPGGPYLLIFNLGDGRGLFVKRGLVFTGRAAFRFKDFIDRRFMRRFGVR